MIRWQVETFDSLPSTQDAVTEKAGEGAPEGLVVQALTQDSGRGRHGSTWNSPKGNLYCSILLRPGCSADEAGQLSFVAAVAVRGAFEALGMEKDIIQLKWPNDVLLEDKKCVGILIESALNGAQVDYVVLGIGINVAAPPEDRVGVSNYIDADVDAVRDALLENLNKTYTQWRAEGFVPMGEAWLENAYKLGKTIKVRLADKTLEGIFEGLDPDGALRLGCDGDVTRILAGEILSK